ncbi:MAG: TrkH family potassium uptake protein [Planctomycetota bacterium]
MSLASVARLLAGFAVFFTAVQAVPLLFAFFEAPSDYDTRTGFGGSMAIGFLVAVLLWLAGRSSDREFHRREGIAVVGFAWTLAGVLGGIPFVWSGALHSGVDATFETISGLTTTGATVLGASATPAIESLPPSLLLWRSLLQFSGGLGIILVFIILLPAMGVTGKSLLASEQTGVSTGLSEPRLLEQARALFRCFLVLNALCALGYWATGMSPFEAACHAMTTMSTGGYSTRNLSIGAFDHVGVEVVATVAMFLGGCNFAWMVAIARSRGRDTRRILQIPELRVYAAMVGSSIAAATLALWLRGGPLPNGSELRDYTSLARCFRDAAFNITSIFTSTGFATADFQNWPTLALLCVLLGMLVGSCTGSTAGGIKMLRVAVCARLAAYHGRRFIRPKSVERLKLGGEVVADPVVSAILAIVVLWLAIVAIGAFVFATDPRLDPMSCLSMSATFMGNTGPALNGVLVEAGQAKLTNSIAINLGPYGSFGDLPAYLKLWGMVQMLLGRLEIMALLVFLSPRFWRR